MKLPEIVVASIQRSQKGYWDHQYLRSSRLFGRGSGLEAGCLSKQILLMGHQEGFQGRYCDDPPQGPLLNCWPSYQFSPTLASAKSGIRTQIDIWNKFHPQLWLGICFIQKSFTKPVSEVPYLAWQKSVSHFNMASFDLSFTSSHFCRAHCNSKQITNLAASWVPIRWSYLE